LAESKEGTTMRNFTIMFARGSHIEIISLQISKNSWTIIPRYLILPKASHIFVIMIMLFI